MNIVMSLKYWLLIVWLSCKWMFRINLGDRIWFNGRKCIVCNGVTLNRWDVEDIETRERFSVAYADCRKAWTPANVLWSFRSGYRFYMRSWFEIWKRNGIESWMRGCNIW